MSQPITIEELIEFVEYDPITGEFTHKTARFIDRKFVFERAVRKPPRKAHGIGDRADKEYGGKFIGLYHNGVVLNAAKCAILISSGEWPQSIEFIDGNWRNLILSNIRPRSLAEQASAAASARGRDRQLPKYVYGTSDGQFIGRRGKFKTEKFKHPNEVLIALQKLTGE